MSRASVYKVEAVGMRDNHISADVCKVGAAGLRDHRISGIEYEKVGAVEMSDLSVSGTA